MINIILTKHHHHYQLYWFFQEDFSNCSTKNEGQKQNLIQVVSNFRQETADVKNQLS